MVLLSKKNIIELNRTTVEQHGGNYVLPFNLLNESNLDYLVEIIDSEMFGAPLYPTLADKAALYMHGIVCNHVFSDGNKRTGLFAATIFLAKNGYDLKLSMSDKMVYDFVIKVASGQSSLEECQDWFKDNITPL